MDSDGIAKIIARLEQFATRPGMFLGTEPRDAERFLYGFSEACHTLGNGFSPHIRRSVETDKGYKVSAEGPVPQMRARGMTDAAMVDELLALEIAYWKRLAEMNGASKPNPAVE